MSERIRSRVRTCVFQDLQVLEYRRALDLQLETRNAKMQDRSLPDQLFFVQHPPVFTFGKRGGKENLMKPDVFLKQQGIDMVQTDRGGNITYHGPGQAVLYPVVDLERACIGVADFVYGLEEIMGRTAEDFGVVINRDPRNRGMWAGTRKIGSVGLSIRRRISTHGLALNVSLDLTPFSWINSCGLSQVAMTSLQQELQVSQKKNIPVSMDAVKEKFVTYFCRLFHFQLIGETTHA